MKKTGINGFGRIGRCLLRALIESERQDVAIVAINSRADIHTAAHLLQYDSTHGKFAATVKVCGNYLSINGQQIRYRQNTDIHTIDWRADDVSTVMECSGVFCARQEAAHHLTAGAQQVLISAPGKDADATIVYGVNEQILGKSRIVSAASCTSNCLAPLLKILNDSFGVVDGWMSTVHAMTADQKLLDESHKDLRRARAAGANIIPTKTGAAEAIGLIIPELKGKISGAALRVPVLNVSFVDLTCRLAAVADVKSVNAAFVAAAAHFPPGVFATSDAPLVSGDYNHGIYSATADLTQTRAIGGLIRVAAWYDNEWGFVNRMLDIAALMNNNDAHC